MSKNTYTEAELRQLLNIPDGAPLTIVPGKQPKTEIDENGEEVMRPARTMRSAPTNAYQRQLRARQTAAIERQKQLQSQQLQDESNTGDESIPEDGRRIPPKIMAHLRRSIALLQSGGAEAREAAIIMQKALQEYTSRRGKSSFDTT